MGDNRVLHFFEEISKIPRESGDEKAISDYLVGFARERGLEVYQDQVYNVIIKKPATVKDCKCAPVILQGHTDMVYVRDAGCNRAYSDGIGLIIKDGYLSADGTTLGADNGIAVAYALAVLDSEDIPHPDLEAVFTVSEETGLTGAQKLDCSRLKGKYLFNMDTEEEGVFFTSCAGAFRNEITLPLYFEQRHGQELTLKISGLRGGHSGAEIHTGMGNAIILIGRVLAALGNRVGIASITAQGKMNAICNNAQAKLFCSPEGLGEIEALVKEMEATFCHELGERDSVKLTLEKGEGKTAKCYTEACRKRAVAILTLIPNGVMGMSFDIEGLVETSANPGFIEQSENRLSILSSSRSSVGSRKEEMRVRYGALAELCGAECVFSGDYPHWEYKQTSPLRDLAKDTYRELFNKEPEAMALHAGLECGHFAQRLRDTDIISYGPNLYDIHTPRERAQLESVDRMWRFTLAILKKLAEQ